MTGYGSGSRKHSSDELDIRHCPIKVKLKARFQNFQQLPQYKLLRPTPQFWNWIES